MKRILSIGDYQWLRGYADFAGAISGYMNEESGTPERMDEEAVSQEIAAYLRLPALDSLEQGDLAAMRDAFGGGQRWESQAGREA